ncbi:uncharacterized protein NECHADRAFT_56571, partial [Fusarium vanettenii 77-13-4]
EVPLRTIKTTIYREEKRGAENHSLPRLGAPRKLTEEQRDQIYNALTTNPNLTHRDLLKSIDNAIKEYSL